MKKKLTKLVICVLAMVLTVGSFSGCQKTYDNEKSPLVLASQALDGVFNPFFSTSGADSSVIGMTQLSMLDTDVIKNDATGELNVVPKAGNDASSVVLDYRYSTVGTKDDQTNEDDYENYYTTYEFVLKNGLKFSDGSDLTIMDVLFNMYIYLDPAYTGSSTMYSTKIRGLEDYRAQTHSLANQQALDATFTAEAEARRANIINYCQERIELTIEPTDSEEVQKTKRQIESDIKKIQEFFKEELETDWSNAQSGIEEFENYVDDKTGANANITEGWQVFFIREGLVSIDQDEQKVKDWGTYKEWGKGYRKNQADKMREDAIKLAFDRKMGTGTNYDRSGIEEVISYWVTATTMFDYLKKDQMSKYFADKRENEGGLEVPTISGITTDVVTEFKGDEYAKRVADGRLSAGAPDFLNGEAHDVLRIVVNGVDPKAIWNFGFSVTPMKYYSSSELVAEAQADFAKYRAGTVSEITNFGVIYGDVNFMNNTVKGCRIPVGAGPYKATNKDGKIKNYEAFYSARGSASDANYKQFYRDNVVYYERNENYLLGAPRIKYLRYKVVNTERSYDSVKTGEVHYADPSAKDLTVKDILRHKNKLDSAQIENLGYGYIGINSTYVPDLEVRQAIMYTLNPELVLNYYKNDLAKVITRPMSTESWAYPKNSTHRYPYTENLKQNDGDLDHDHDGWKSEELIEAAGYEKDRNSGKYRIWRKGKWEYLTLTFTVAGDSTDHPAYSVLEESARILNSIGCTVKVVTDAQALSKLSNGSLAVWAAAWSSTIDPDMFQVYHMDSTATSVNNWGYPHILYGDSSVYPSIMREQQIVKQLSDLIDVAREKTANADRVQDYSDALDLVMELAVEFPLYQRKNLFVWDKTVIDSDSLVPVSRRSSYMSPLAEIWNVSFKK